MAVPDNSHPVYSTVVAEEPRTLYFIKT